MTYEQWLTAYNDAPGGTAVLIVSVVSIALAFVVGHLTSKALRNGGQFRRLFAAFGCGLLTFVFVIAPSSALTRTLAQAPLVEDYPEYAERQRQEEIQSAARDTDRQLTRTGDPAVQACADMYRFNTNSADPDEWERTHDVGAGRKRAARRFDGSAVLHEGQQVYSVVIPRNGESVNFDRYGLSREGSGCRVFQDPETGSWQSSYGL